MYLSILVLPLLGSFVAGFMGRKVGVSGAQFITCSCLLLASILSSVAFYEVGICGSPLSINLGSWIDSEFMTISWEFLFDQLTVSMFIPVLFISTLIHIYSVSYFDGDPHNQRFFSYLSLFTFFMLILASGANYFVLFVGWEGIGIVSYLLINFWFTRIQANKAAILALTMNRVGDMGLSIGFFALFALFGSLDYSVIFSITPLMNETAITIIGILLLTGAMAKSAQIPLHSWLPGSMEGGCLMESNLTYYRIEINIKNLIMLFILSLLINQNSIFIFLDSESNIYLLHSMVSFILPENLERGSDGKFKSSNKLIVPKPLPNKVLEALVGDMLGDGHIRYTKKELDGKPRGNSNAQFEMTLKSRDHVYFLWRDIYSPICTETPPNPWPKPKSGKPATQYHFSSRALPAISQIHNQWYVWSDDNKKFIKIIPSNIFDLLTDIGLAHWIMGDGYWNKESNTAVICTDNFTLDEVKLLISVLDEKFKLNSTLQRRIKSNKELCWRIRFSNKHENIEQLRLLVLPHMIPSMTYKLNA